jgi:hypothetical protein
MLLSTFEDNGWMAKLNTDNMAFGKDDGSDAVLSVESAKVAEMMIYISKMDDYSSKSTLSSKMKSGIEKMVKNGYEDEELFFVVSSELTECQSFIGLNSQVLKLINYAKKSYKDLEIN